MATTPDMRKARLSPTEYLKLCWTSFKRHWRQYTLPVVAVLLLQTFLRVDINYTDSLPDHVFITVKGWKTGLKHGDYVTYGFPTANSVSLFRKGDHMVKRVAGVEGDEIRMREDGEFFVLYRGATTLLPDELGNDSLGKAKPYSMTGRPLQAGPVGVIPPGHFYVHAPHRDSLDSRYAMVGWIRESDVIGRTFPIF